MFSEKITQLIQSLREKMAQFGSEFFDPEYVEETINAIETKLKKLDEQLDGNSQLQVALQNTLAKFFNEYLPQIYLGGKSEMTTEATFIQQTQQRVNPYFNNIISDVKRLEYLAIINNRNITIVGGNGAGKSSFASYLKQSSSENIIVIPAQKYLYADTTQGNSHLTIDNNELQQATSIDYISLGKTTGNQFEYDRQNGQLFTKLITSIVNEHLRELDKAYENHEAEIETQLTELKRVWSMIFPNIELKHEVTYRSMSVVKNNSPYSINAMSDGEKAVLYYLLQILFAPTHSFVLVDEPETYLNPTVSNRLWDTLEAIRNDINFIYISHNINFISSRKDTSLLWIKNYTYPDDWELKELEMVAERLPRELVIELVGTKKPIIFIEGTISSPDYALFSGMFKNKAIILPVEGHKNVIAYTEAYNNSPDIKTEEGQAFGIVDRDLMDITEIAALEEKAVYALPFNEIEMMFFEEDLMKLYLEELYYTDVDKIKSKIETFKTDFFAEVEKNITKILEQKSKKILDTFLERERVDKFRGKKPAEMLKEITSKLEDLNLESRVSSFEKELTSVIADKDYSQLLVLSPLKEQVSKGLANRLLDSEYMNKMASKFKHQAKYTDILKGKYFPDLDSKLSES